MFVTACKLQIVRGGCQEPYSPACVQICDRIRFLSVATEALAFRDNPGNRGPGRLLACLIREGSGVSFLWNRRTLPDSLGLRL